MAKRQKENQSYKNALLMALDTIIYECGKVYFDGYEKESDRLQFTFYKHKCRLYQLNNIDLISGSISIELKVKNRFCFFNIEIKHLNPKTLYKIVLESYMCSSMPSKHGDDGEEWIKEQVGNYFDTFGY